MITITKGNWIADLGAMTCRNIENRVAVTFTQKANTFEGKIQDMPVEVLEDWAALTEGERLVRQAVEEAEEVFLRAWFENRITREENK
jgi:hypothetical protein